MVGMADEHGFAHTSIGYVPITARRGGIQYPKRTMKGTHTMTTSTDRAELDKALELRDTLDERIAELRERVSRRPAEPDAGLYGDTFAVDVKFSTRGKTYRFLLLRTPGAWYTTGMHKENNCFLNWDALMDWLNGPDVAWHSTVVSLKADRVVTGTGK